jgi:hypothetical protein
VGWQDQPGGHKGGSCKEVGWLLHGRQVCGLMVGVAGVDYWAVLL